MTELEQKVKKLENDIFVLREIITNSMAYSQDIQSALWESEDKQKEKNKDLSNSTNNVSNNLINYEVRNDAKLNNTISDTWVPRVWTVGEFCTYNDRFWKCEVNNSNAPSESMEWRAVNIAEVMIDLLNRVTKLESEV